MNARTVRKALSVALLTAAVGLVFAQGSAPRAEPFQAFGKAFSNNPRPPKSPSAKKSKPKVEVTPNPESPYYNGGGQGYVATPPAIPPAAVAPSYTDPNAAVAVPVQYRPATAPGVVPAGQGTLALQQQQMQAQQLRAAEQYAQQQAAQQQMARQQLQAQQQLTGQATAPQPQTTQGQAVQAQAAQIPAGQPQVGQPQTGQPQAAQPESAAQVHDYVAEMYKRDGRDIAQWDYQSMGYNPQPVYRQQGAQGTNLPRKPSFLQRWVPGYSRLFPGRPDTAPAQQTQSPPQIPPAQPQYQQPAQAPQYAQPNGTLPQSAQPQYGSVAPQTPAPSLGQPAYAQPGFAQPNPQLAGPARPGTLAPGGQVSPPVVGRVGVPVAQPGARPGYGQPVLTPPPALAARPGVNTPPQPLPQPEIPGLAPAATPAAPGPDLSTPANVAATPPATPPANGAGPQLPVLDILAEPAPKTAAATPAKPLDGDLLLDEAAADKAEANESLLLTDDKPNSAAPNAAPAANTPLLADEPVVETPKENPYTGRKLEIDERVAVTLPNPAASLLDDEDDEDRRMLVADASLGRATVSGADAPELPTPPTVNTPPVTSNEPNATPSGVATPIDSNSTPPALLTPPDMPADDREQTERPKLAARPTLKGFKGFCPVTLRNSRRLVEAKLEFSSEYAGMSFQFATPEAKAEFDAAPERYVPAKGGRDVVQASASPDAQEGSLDHAVWYRGKLYLFATPATREQFVGEPAKFAVP